jgi:hypothetical protein
VRVDDVDLLNMVVVPTLYLKYGRSGIVPESSTHEAQT